MYSVNMNENKMIIYNNKQDIGNSNLQNGAIIQGTIISFNNDKALIEISDKTIETSKNNITGNVGDKIDFEIINNKDGVQLKQVSKKDFALIEQAERVKYNKNLLDKDNRNALDIEEKSIIQKEVEKKIELVNLKRKIKSDYNNINKNIMKKIMTEGADVGKIPLSTMTSIQADIQEDVSSMPKNEIKQRLEKNNINKNNYNEIVNQFKNSGLNFNDNNLMAISNSLQKFNDVIQSSDINSAYAVKDNKTITINNLYASKNVSSQKNIDEDMTDKVKQFLAKNNIEINEQNISSSLHLLDNEVSISESNIQKVNFIRSELKNIDEKNLISNFVKALQNGENPADLNLMTLTEEVKQNHKTNLNILNEISNVSDETLAFLQENGIEFTLSNIVQNKNKGSNIVLNESSLVAKRQMLDIQLKLTSEISFTLANKGIEIDIIPLKEVLNEIKTVESTIYAKMLQVENLEITEQNLNDIHDVFDKLKLFNETTNSIYKKVINNEIQFNIDEISDEIFSNKIAKSYEENQTVVSTKFKDTFNKVKEQVSPLLNQLNIEDNDLNVKASSILIKNKMDVTQENINNVLLVDTKVNELNSELQPNIVLKMLQENINPLTTNIDDMLQYIEDYNIENSIKSTSDENIIKNLIKLEKDKSVSESELKTIKAVYRAISHSIKNDTGIGAFVNSQHDFTIGNLLDSTKYMQKTKGNYNYLDETVSDTKGYVDNSNKESLTIKEQVESQLNKYLLNNVAKNNNIDFIKQLSNEDNTLKSLFDDELVNEVTEEEAIQQVNRLQNTNNEEIHDYLLKNNMPINITNMEIVKEILKDDLYQTKKLKDAVSKNEKLKEKLYNIEKDNLENTISENNVIADIIDELKNEDVETEVKQLSLQQQLIQSMKFQDEFNKSNETQYELPILLPLSSESTNLKMFIPNKNALNNNESLVIFSLSTENLGDIKISANYNEKFKSVNISIDNDDEKILRKLDSDKQYLIDSLKKLGVENVTFETI